ncbi:hypoxanthine phosphoribosyltransferase [Acidobacteria bacterium AH-259-D05]|nr:hypoxanthine phosphoribosyltransferase [Acidobacteria bacterium AH-259-D05]
MSSPHDIRSKDAPGAVKKIIFDEETISKRVEELAGKISQDYSGKDPVVVGILQGAYVFTHDLVKKLSFPVSPDFIRISRYQRRPHTGEVEIIEDLQENITGKQVLLIEDIIDTGLTLNYLVQILLTRNPASLAVCTLLDRSELRLVEIPIQYVGFQVNDEYLIGYGLDFRGFYRDLPFVATMDLQSVEDRPELTDHLTA